MNLSFSAAGGAPAGARSAVAAGMSVITAIYPNQMGSRSIEPNVPGERRRKLKSRERCGVDGTGAEEEELVEPIERWKSMAW
jgi:hypothetical protein